MMKDSFLNKKFKYTYSNATLYLVVINVLVFIATASNRISFRGIPLFYWLSLVPGFVNMGWVWQLVTYMFVHGSISHLFFNMLALFMFGRLLERTLGTREFLLFYFVCGIMGGVVHYLYYALQGAVIGVPVMGASGAIYALLFLCAVMFPNAQILLFFFIPMKMPYAVMVFVAIEIFFHIFGIANGVAHLLHLSCILFAWIYVMVRFRVNPIKVWKDNL